MIILNRIYFIDYLKVLGLLLVILAHVQAPDFIMQVRSFDVTLLVFISAYLASIRNKNIGNMTYFTKRFKRLVFPTWIFLCIFFVIQSIFLSRPTVINMIKAFTFQKDAYLLGMVWIIWVYLSTSIFIPTLNFLKFNVKNRVIMILIFIFYEFLVSYTQISESRFLYNTVLTIIPWYYVSYLGFNFNKMKRNDKYFIYSIGIAYFLAFSLIIFYKTNSFPFTFQYKYPPTLYYFSYSVPASILLFDIFRSLKFNHNSIVNFISRSSLWVYLWHILVLYIVKYIVYIDRLWFIQYIMIVFFSIFITFIQNCIIKYLIYKYNFKFLNVFLG
ncbi:acyltransferase family protein [Facklamia hominis]|uniref:acyltransferase family protein n=1 Tax=Facklamia hominis TaxID=178214 RepID=UPI0003545794|nr:hypothetical protein HMPREF9260_00314 [Facklamia hominis ACS-120-V-Sch10]